MKLSLNFDQNSPVAQFDAVSPLGSARIATGDVSDATRCRIRSRVAVPLAGADGAQFMTFHGLSDGREHFCVSFEGWEEAERPLVRVHSECLTGDMFGSLRCDCGPQLAQAQALMVEQGGLIVYLRQEGRGIGLYNKLETYELQSDGFDTFAANVALGFEEDERSYRVAYEMLDCLGVGAVRLMTNNPDKVAQLRRYGLDVAMQPTGQFENPHNRCYLEAKRERIAAQERTATTPAKSVANTITNLAK